MNKTKLLISSIISIMIVGCSNDAGSNEQADAKKQAINFIEESIQADNYLRTSLVPPRQSPQTSIKFNDNGCGFILEFKTNGSRDTSILKDINKVSIYSKIASFDTVNDSKSISIECKKGISCVEFTHDDFNFREANTKGKKQTIMNPLLTKNIKLTDDIVRKFEIIQKSCSNK